MRISKTTIAAIGAVGALALAVPAIGQEGGDPPETTEQTREEVRAERHQRFAEALAEELDLPVDDVTAALEAVRERLHAEHGALRLERLEERLNAAVESGDLTQEQADAIRDAAEAGVFPRRGHGGQGPHGRPGHHAPWSADANGDAETTST